MQISNEYLFELIQKLTKTEKRYFSVVLQKGKNGKKVDNPQLTLFNIINDLDEYDEDKVKARLNKKLGKGEKTDKFIKRLSLEKHNLYYAILKKIRTYNSENSDYIKLKNILIDAKYLLDRGLYKQSARQLEKAKKLAQRYGDQLTLLEINRTERTLVWKLKNKKEKKNIEQLIDRKEAMLEYLIAEMTYQDYYDKLCLQMIRHHSLTKNQIEEVKDDFHHFIFDENELKKTAFADLRNIQMKGFYHRLMGESDLVFEATTAEYRWWEDNPQYKKEDFFRYKVSLHNYLLAYYNRKDFDKVLEIISNLEKKKSKSFFETLMIFDFKSLFQLLIYMNRTQFDEAKKMIPEIKKGLRNYALSVSKKNALINNLGILFFLSEDFEHSKKWLLQLIKGHNKGNREDIRIFAKLLLAICYLELEDIDRIENLFRSIDRSIIDNAQINEGDLEYDVLTHLKKIARAPVLELPDALTAFKNDLEKIKGDAGKKKSVPFLEEFLIWTESRLTNRPLADILRDDEN